jgi:hypothetical protein
MSSRPEHNNLDMEGALASRRRSPSESLRPTVATPSSPPDHGPQKARQFLASTLSFTAS